MKLYNNIFTGVAYGVVFVSQKVKRNLTWKAQPVDMFPQTSHVEGIL